MLNYIVVDLVQCDNGVCHSEADEFHWKGSDAARLVCIKCNAMHSRDGMLQQREAGCMLFIVHCQLSRDLTGQSPWLIDLPYLYGAQELLGWL